MPTPDQWNRIKEDRKKLRPDERRTKALEDIADELMMLRETVANLPHQLKMHFPAKI
jgi:predicted transcriptional regulator